MRFACDSVNDSSFNSLFGKVVMKTKFVAENSGRALMYQVKKAQTVNN